MSQVSEKSEVHRTERGWAGHFICSANCRFRRNTLLEYGESRIVVSTVGNYFPTAYAVDSMPEQIGWERYYETMAFYSDRNDGKYHDADVTKEVNFDSNWAIGEKYADNEANAMHETVVAEITERLLNGEYVDYATVKRRIS